MKVGDSHPMTMEAFTFESVRLDRTGSVIENISGSAQVFHETIAPGLVLTFVALPGGTFSMGSIKGQGFEEETPRHLVSLQPFFIGQFPVTQEQWKAVMGKAAQGRFSGSRLPVDRISWEDANAFCRKLAKLTGRAYCLPSEAQWEFAARAGSQTPFSTGESITTDYANFCGPHRYREEPPGLYRHQTTLVDAFLPNAYGIYDMQGNLWEWCADRWHADYTAAPFNGEPWEHGGEPGYRVLRGGSWHEPPANCRPAVRLRGVETEPDDMYGFRIALN